MRVIDPQSAALTNIEVLAYLTANPPRRPPNPPPNSRNWIPSPDLRDHNTVVKEIHNYIHRLSPHITSYPRYIHGEPPQHNPYEDENVTNKSKEGAGAGAEVEPRRPRPVPQSQAEQNKPTPMDAALRALVTRLKPFGLTKAEVLMIVNLGIGVGSSPGAGEEEGEGEGEEGGQEAEGEGGDQVNGEAMEVDGGHEQAGETAEEGGQEGEPEPEVAEEDYGPLALLDTVIEEREERLSQEDVVQLLAIIRETLGAGGSAGGEGS